MMSKGMRRLVRWIVFSSSILGVIFLLRPSYYADARAYDAALDMLPAPVWGLIWCVTATIGFAILSDVAPHWIRPWFLGLYAFPQMMFAWSIFILTFEDARGAIAGSIQWLAPLYFVMAVLYDRDRPWGKGE